MNFIFCVNTNSQTQKIQSIYSKSNSESNDFIVTWINNISSIEDLKEDKSFFKSMKEFVFGKENINLKKPVNLVIFDTTKYIILDQGIQYPVIINTEKYKFDIYKEINSFPSLVGICKWKDNKILFTDSRLNKIYYFSLDNLTPIILNENLSLDQPTGIAYSPITNEIWVSETGKHQITILDNTGNIKKNIGKRGSEKLEFNFPTYICIDKSGNSYVVDAMNFRIQVFNSNYELISIFGETGDSPGYFSSIKGIATDSYGHIFIVDALFNVIQVFDINGNFLHTFGGQGKNNGEFFLPTGIYIDSYNKIYVADTYNSRISIFQLSKGQ